MPGPRGLVQLLDQYLHRTDFPRGAGLLVAVSGGADSVALLRLLAEINGSTFWHWRLVVGHVDHGLRGGASRGDGRFVAQLARQMGLPHVERRLKLGRRSSEDTARQARLAALAGMCRKSRCAAVVMAHHADDQAETVLMRLFRGTGIEGLAAMAFRTQIAGMTVLRPLLALRRSDLRDYLGRIGQTWREDQTNRSDVYLRNRVRQQLLPLVETLWPRAVEALGRVALLAADSADIVRAAARRVWDEVPKVRIRSGLWFRRDALLGQSPAMTAEVLQIVLGEIETPPVAPGLVRIRAAVRVLQDLHGRKTVELGGGLCVKTQGKLACVYQAGRRKRPPQLSPAERSRLP